MSTAAVGGLVCEAGAMWSSWCLLSDW